MGVLEGGAGAQLLRALRDGLRDHDLRDLRAPCRHSGDLRQRHEAPSAKLPSLETGTETGFRGESEAPTVGEVLLQRRAREGREERLHREPERRLRFGPRHRQPGEGSCKPSTNSICSPRRCPKETFWRSFATRPWTTSSAMPRSALAQGGEESEQKDSRAACQWRRTRIFALTIDLCVWC